MLRHSTSKLASFLFFNNSLINLYNDVTNLMLL